MHATIVTFPSRALRGDATVLFAEAGSDGAVIVTDLTPFHPVDHTWPDQPGDTGTITGAEGSAVVTEAVMAAISAEGHFAVGNGIPVKRGGEGWTWLVGHRLDSPTPPDWLRVDSAVTLEVRSERRAGLSRGHTACHLASLALDSAGGSVAKGSRARRPRRAELRSARQPVQQNP